MIIISNNNNNEYLTRGYFDFFLFNGAFSDSMWSLYIAGAYEISL
jgi:hypothetical protein